MKSDLALNNMHVFPGWNVFNPNFFRKNAAQGKKGENKYILKCYIIYKLGKHYSLKLYVCF